MNEVHPPPPNEFRFVFLRLNCRNSVIWQTPEIHVQAQRCLMDSIREDVKENNGCNFPFDQLSGEKCNLRHRSHKSFASAAAFSQSCVHAVQGKDSCVARYYAIIITWVPTLHSNTSEHSRGTHFHNSIIMGKDVSDANFKPY